MVQNIAPLFEIQNPYLNTQTKIMYTTLELLKTVKACVPGYSRMISFFGQGKDTKTQHIPLHVVALVGGASDAEWAMGNGFIIDEKEYEAFYRRHLPAVFKQLFYDKVAYYVRHSTRDSSLDKNPILKSLVDKCYKIHTFEQIEEHLKEIKKYHFSHKLYSSFMADDCWNSPFHFIQHCMGIVESTYNVTGKVFFPEDRKPKTQPTPARLRRAIPARHRDDDEEVEDFDGDDESDGDVEETAEGHAYWIRSTSKNNTKGQNVAAMLNTDPYAFMTQLKFKVPAGMQVVTDGGVPRLEVKVENTKDMFLVLRTMTAKTQIADQDADDE